jgi:succinate dehydrogenase/fumarate reductase flavoprotein subunit
VIARLLGLPIWQLLAGAALLGAAVGGSGAGLIVYRVQDARVLSCETAASSAALAAANFAAKQIEAAHRAAEDATVEALRRADVAETLARRYRGEIDRLAVGRPCFSSELRGLLQQSPAFVPFAPGGTPGATPAVATYTGDSTDADVARWVVDASSMYEVCRGRIDALRGVYGEPR